MIPKSFLFAVATRRVPESFRYDCRGRMHLVQIAAAFGWLDPIYGGKRSIARLGISANNEVHRQGSGNRAARREAMYETTAWHDHHVALREADVDALAERDRQ
jgi:hypothetical protein